MKKCSSTLLLLAAIMLCLPLRLTEASTNLAAISASEKVTFDIPSHLSAGDDIIRKFQAVSSHGRSDVLKDATPVTYTIFQISLRAAFLMIVFTPMMCTSGLAFVFSGFRNGIWFQLLRFGISQGGAVGSFNFGTHLVQIITAISLLLRFFCVTGRGVKYDYLPQKRNNTLIYLNPKIRRS